MVAKKHVRLLLLAGGAAAIAFLAWYVFSPSGAEPEKKTPEELRAQLVERDTPPETQAAAGIQPKTRAAAAAQAETLAEAAAQLGALRDRQSMPLLIAALDDEDLNVRARAGAAVIQILGADFFFRADDPPERRRETANRIKKHWEAWLAKEPLP